MVSPILAGVMSGVVLLAQRHIVFQVSPTTEAFIFMSAMHPTRKIRCQLASGGSTHVVPAEHGCKLACMFDRHACAACMILYRVTCNGYTCRLPSP